MCDGILDRRSLGMGRSSEGLASVVELTLSKRKAHYLRRGLLIEDSREKQYLRLDIFVFMSSLQTFVCATCSQLCGAVHVSSVCALR